MAITVTTVNKNTQVTHL